MTEKRKINVIDATNPNRMGFYVPGHGIVTTIKKDSTPKPGDLFQLAVKRQREKAQKNSNK